jgi:hypothetical protein
MALATAAIAVIPAPINGLSGNSMKSRSITSAFVKKLMKHKCANCEGTTFLVVKTFPYAHHTLRQLKCRSCGTNFFTHEYVMQDDEYCWQMIDGKSRLRLIEK